MGAFVISKRFDEYYKFVFTSRKGKAIFTSFRYELKFECEEGIEYFKNAIDTVVFEKVKSAGGKYFFKIMWIKVGSQNVFFTDEMWSPRQRNKSNVLSKTSEFCNDLKVLCPKNEF